MKLTVIGCGMAAPDAERVASGYHVQATGVSMLLDCGPGVVHRMATLGTEWQKLTHLCISHFHNDHIGDVPALFFAWRWGMAQARQDPLTVIGPKGTKKKLQQLATAFGDHISKPTFDLEIFEIGPDERRLLGDVVHITADRMTHTPEAIGFRVETSNLSLGYTGDTGESGEAAAFFHRVDTLVMECSLPDELGFPMHLTPTSAARMANIAQPKRLVLTHVYPQLDRAALPQLMRDAGWNGETVIAEDGLTLEVGFGG
jgi:ribonuclease BN (tRNA processing enzyme)